MLWLTVNLQLHPFPWMSNGPSKWMPSYSKKDSVTTLKLPFDQNHPKASWSGIWVCLTAASSKNVLYGLWIFAVDAFHTALICHLPSAELCEESSSLFCPLCQLRGSSSTLAIRQSCRDSSYASSRERLDYTSLPHTRGWAVGLCLTQNELSYGHP